MSIGAKNGKAPRVLAVVHRAEDILLALLLGTLVLLAPMQIVLRNFFDAGWVWTDPFLRVLVLWVALLGALAASRDDRQIAVDVVSQFLSARPKAAAGAVIGLFTAFVCGLVAYHASLFVLGEWEFGSRAFGEVPAWLCQVVIPFAFAMIALRHASRAFTQAGVALGLSPLPDESEDETEDAAGGEA